MFQGVQCDFDDLVIGNFQEVTQWLDATLLDQIADDLWLVQPTRRGVGDGPTSFLLGLVAVLIKDILVELNRARTGSIALQERTKSLYSEESPATLPKAQIACSLTSADGEYNNWTNFGMAPASTTNAVWSEEPEAMLVKAQAASSCNNSGASDMNWTKFGTIPDWITRSIGGLRSFESNCLNLIVASNCSSKSLDCTC
ncbi:hypothetical protein WICPIJ_001113 [Wickerhamomyces pijperi]|uniref:Uncharacterized protein n=1 Tax=Wickerhamomyces pijperi TaxID=599730 RepID=A0A9P8QCD1_WICPI|nr:hypothetical protein WICPIJ_001113 [Wickerhamomyces pijperi]